MNERLPSFKISGTVAQVAASLYMVKATTMFRNNFGWPAFLDDEIWDYYTEQDDLVCPTCDGFGIKAEFPGPDVPSDLPDQIPVDVSDTLRRHRAPQVHVTYPERRGKCRCNIYWRNPVETLLYRFHNELMENLG